MAVTEVEVRFINRSKDGIKPTFLSENVSKKDLKFELGTTDQQLTNCTGRKRVDFCEFVIRRGI